MQQETTGQVPKNTQEANDGKAYEHGEGGIYQRESDGKWCASVDLGLMNGKRRRKVMYGETRKKVAD
jgi:hypothetical protein